MKRIDRMKNMIMQIDNILTGLGPSQANERDIAAILSNLALSYDVPAHIYNEKGKVTEIQEPEHHQLSTASLKAERQILFSMLRRQNKKG